MATIVQDGNLDNLDKLLVSPSEYLVKDIQKRYENWLTLKNEVFPDAESKFRDIRKDMTSGNIVNKDIHGITADMAWLTAYYDFIVEAEGIASARKVLNERCFDDNVFFMKAQGIIKTSNNNEARALALRVKANFFVPLYKEIVEADNIMALLGIVRESKQTSRSSSIQMIIEIYKKRHDALLKTYNVTGGRRSD